MDLYCIVYIGNKINYVYKGGIVLCGVGGVSPGGALDLASLGLGYDIVAVGGGNLFWFYFLWKQPYYMF